jgi:hypothetical protein
VNAAGDAVVVWAQSETGGRVVQASHRPASSGAWSVPVALSAPGAELEADVAVNAAGDAVAVWSRAGIEAAFKPAGGGWASASAAAVSASPAQRAVPDVGLDPAGNAVAVWIEGGVVRTAARSRSTAAWSVPENLSAAGATQARVAVDPRGNAVAVWIDAGRTARAALRPAAAGRWLAAVALSAAGAATSDLELAVDGAGSAVAVWNRGDSRSGLVDAAELDPAGPVLAGLTVPARGAARVAVAFAVEPAPWAAPLAGQPLWSFGDGSSATGARVSHAYRQAGRFGVSVTQADAAGGAASATATITIAAPTLRNIVRPSIRGRPRVGATLVCLHGRWSGTPPIRYAYRWLRARTAIPGATSERYRVRRRDVGALLACRLTARNAAGSKTATSQAVRVRR